MNWSTDVEIPEAERIENLVAVDNDDSSNVWNARWIMRMFDKLLDGLYTLRIPRWTTATRPSPVYAGQIGMNTDTGGGADGSVAQEVYTGTGWFVISGTWKQGSQPTGILAGSKGYNQDGDIFEYYDGSDWQPIGG